MDKKALVSAKNVKMIYSNRICCFDDEQISLNYKLTNKKDDELKIHFLFKYSNDSKQGIEMNTGPKEEIVIKLKNFNNPLGAGLKKPIQIARLNNKGIFLIFNIYKNNESNPILDLSLYMEN